MEGRATLCALITHRTNESKLQTNAKTTGNTPRYTTCTLMQRKICQDCCHACSARSDCGRWTHLDKKCRIFSDTDSDTTMRRNRKAVSGSPAVDARGSTQVDWDYCVPPPLPTGDCFCDETCVFNDDCCVDVQLQCPRVLQAAAGLSTPDALAMHIWRSQETANGAAPTPPPSLGSSVYGPWLTGSHGLLHSGPSAGGLQYEDIWSLYQPLLGPAFQRNYQVGAAVNAQYSYPSWWYL